MVILDTNLISELMSEAPNEAVAAWARKQRPESCVTTAINIQELQSGIEILVASKRRTKMEASFGWVLDNVIGNRVLDFDRKAAMQAASWFVERRRQGRPIDGADVQIAGIALSRRIPLATRNVADFEGLQVKLINPWSGQS